MNKLKNKIVFGGVLLLILLFLISYSYMILEEDQPADGLNQPTLPEWQETTEDFKTKTEALDALRESKASQNIPSPYPDHMVDEKGYFNPDYMEMEKHRIIDSIYAQSHFKVRPEENPYTRNASKDHSVSQVQSAPNEPKKIASEIALEHQLFFAGHARPEYATSIPARIEGDQVIKKDSRVAIKLLKSMAWGNDTLQKNQEVWGTVAFGPNRLYIAVSEVAEHELQLEAYDLQDGLRGIYLENSFRGEAGNQLLQDLSQDINVPGLPSTRSLKNVFRRRQQKIKVNVLDGHSFLLKSKN